MPIPRKGISINCLGEGVEMRLNAGTRPAGVVDTEAAEPGVAAHPFQRRGRLAKVPSPGPPGCESDAAVLVGEQRRRLAELEDLPSAESISPAAWQRSHCQPPSRVQPGPGGELVSGHRPGTIKRTVQSGCRGGSWETTSRCS